MPTGAERDNALAVDVAILKARQEAADARITKLEGIIGKVVWLIIGAIIAAAMGFLLKSGLSVTLPQP